jgi:hypothetical protein
MTTSHMHCPNPDCVDDNCHGECLKQNEKPDDCCSSSCGCYEEIEENIAYCEDS